MTASLPAVSLHQPYAFAVAHLGKNVENRSWAISLRGPIAVHATLKWDPAGARNPYVQDAWLKGGFRSSLDEQSPQIHYGAVVAVADIVDCHLFDSVDHCGYIGDQILPGYPTLCSDWAAQGQWHWELGNVRPLRAPVPCRGAQRIWRLPTDVDATVRAQLGLESAA